MRMEGEKANITICERPGQKGTVIKIVESDRLVCIKDGNELWWIPTHTQGNPERAVATSEFVFFLWDGDLLVCNWDAVEKGTNPLPERNDPSMTYFGECHTCYQEFETIECFERDDLHFVKVTRNSGQDMFAWEFSAATPKGKLVDGNFEILIREPFDFLSF